MSAQTPTGETKFNVLCSLLTWIQRTKPSAKKRAKLRKFLDTFCHPTDYFSAVRLILPSLDRERGSYGLKESVLATSLVDALGMSRDSQDALRLINWRKGGAKTGVNAGNFPLVAAEVLERRQGMTSGGLTIKELNDLLDRLASSENRAEKTSVLTTLIKKTNSQEMKWIVMIILKDLKLGMSEKSVFHEFHPDAEDLFNVTCDLKLVCEKLSDRRQRHKRQDIEVGKAVRPQLAMRVANATAAWKKLHGKEVVVECKFDGDRIQIHKNGSEIHFFSRNFFDHSEYEPAMSHLITQNIVADRCILDGEMLVWDTSLNRFSEFGSNQEIAKAAKDGLESDRQLCYVAFDILYVGDTSVIHQSLKERHELLQKVVKPFKGRLEILIPDGGLNSRRPSGEPCWSFIAHNVDEVEKFFKETVENRNGCNRSSSAVASINFNRRINAPFHQIWHKDEGIVLKDLGSKWEPSDRSGKWMKLKPDYIRAGSDLDVLIIGGYHGSGRRGGEVAQFLVGLAERPAANAYPRRFVSFCRVGTGLSDDELDAVVTKLKPYFRKYEYPKKAPPSYYEVTNNSKERPDVWIDSPEKSIILSITSDIRTIRSGVFAAPYSLRFPRIDRVKYDKPWHECLDVETFVELVHSSNGTTQRESENGNLEDSKPKRMKSSKRGDRKNLSVVPSHFVQTDVSNVKGETLIFSNMVFYFVNGPPSHSLDSLHKMVAENGGGFSMNLNNSVTHCVAADSKGLKYQAAKLCTDVIHYSWVLECCLQKKLLQLQPKHYLFLSDSSKKKLQEEIDEYSDSYFCDLDLVGLQQLLSSIDRAADTSAIEYYKRKYCPKDKWSYLHGCCIYFHTSMASLNPGLEVISLGLALRRLKLEVSMAGGKVCNNLADASHLVVMLEPGSDVDFATLSTSFTMSEKHLLWNKRLHVVRSQWLEECLLVEQKLNEEKYSLKPSRFEELVHEEWKRDLEAPSNLSHKESKNSPSPENKEKQSRTEVALENPRMLASPKRDEKRKRGRPAGKSTNKGKIGMNQPRRTRPRLRNKPAKISGNESDEGDFSDENTHGEFVGARESNCEKDGILGNPHSKIPNSEIVEDSVSLCRSKVAQQEAVEGTRLEKFNEVPRSETSRRHGGLSTENPDEDEVMADPIHSKRPEKQEFMDDAGSSKNSQKLEVMVDPVHSMLLDMIPSLGAKKVVTKNPILESKKPSEDPVAEPPKKKKVSYKDVAGELLKDW